MCSRSVLVLLTCAKEWLYPSNVALTSTGAEKKVSIATLKQAKVPFVDVNGKMERAASIETLRVWKMKPYR